MTCDDLGMSTSWNGAGVEDGRRIVDEITALGFARIEVEYRVSEDAIGGIEEAVRSGRITVSSIHNFSPLPSGEKPTSRGGDRLSLASQHEAERAEAVRLTLRSLQLARRLGAKALILHLGGVDTGREYFKELSDVVQAEGVNSEEAIRIRGDIKTAREAGKGVFLDSALRSLKDILARAHGSGVSICVENRYYYHQIPLPEEIAKIKREIPSSMLRYWHDIGHAHVQEVLGFSSHLDTLDLLKDHIFGMHIHDSVFIRDHKAPGSGEIDFARVFEKVANPILRILELAPTVSAEDIRRSVDYLKAEAQRRSGTLRNT